ncbi:MAG: hypothetical protein PHS79_03980 [Patescibacteria group bacterium]|nr:hypothetical protein [Patescibacteria group bacterium]
MNESDAAYLLQDDVRASVDADVGASAWVTAYRKVQDQAENGGVFCALVPDADILDSLASGTWDMSVGSGCPGCSQSFDGATRTTAYHRYGRAGGIEPLVFVRDHNGLHPRSIEILEEYRHFHNLYFDATRAEYLRVDDGGREEVVVKVLPDRVDMLLRPLRQFLALKRMHLALLYDMVRFSEQSVDVIPHQKRSTVVSLSDRRYSIDIRECDWMRDRKFRSFSRLLGKRLIPPLPVEQSGIWPYNEDEQRQYCEFIIARDSEGKELRYTSDPARLANYFGKNPRAPHYLTPVFFQREVLKKYYDQTAKYRVVDGALFCGDLWMLRIDNNHETHVVAFLGDLGETLSYEEQLHWLHHNVAPEGGVSEVEWKRSFLAEPSEPTSADLIFVRALVRFQDDWVTQHGWPLFLPLLSGDEHYFRGLHVPVTKDATEFEQQVLALTKLLVDSINVAEISRLLPAGPKDEKSLAKLDRYHEANQYPARAADLKLLRDLQDLRSSGVAHRKGHRYDEVAERFGIPDREPGAVFEGILKRLTDMLGALSAHYMPAHTGAPAPGEGSIE